MVDFAAAARQTFRNISSLRHTSIIEEVSGGAYNTETGVVEGATTTRHSVVSTPPIQWSTFYKSSSQAKESSSVLIVPGFNCPVEIKTGMTVETADKRWKVVNCVPHQVGGYTVAYELELNLG